MWSTLYILLSDVSIWQLNENNKKFLAIQTISISIISSECKLYKVDLNLGRAKVINICELIKIYVTKNLFQGESRYSDVAISKPPVTT